MINISSALISVFSKENLESVVNELTRHKINIYSTGGTLDFIQKMGVKGVPVENLTGYPSIFGGRVKTLHPKVFGGILFQRDKKEDVQEAEQYEIPSIDLVIVDLYPFEETIKSGASHEDIIEKIDIGGVSLIRAAAKNYNSVIIISCKSQYKSLVEILSKQGGKINLEQRKQFAAEAFLNTMKYDMAIANYFNKDIFTTFSKPNVKLRYGENPHQQGNYYGNLGEIFEQLGGKEISYNNLLDIDAALSLISDFKGEAATCAIIKHNNACGCATASNAMEAWSKALSSDPLSAFGGIIVCNKPIGKDVAEEINKIFSEIIIAPSFLDGALDILKSKKNRIILKLNSFEDNNIQYRSLLNGVLLQEKDLHTETAEDLKICTKLSPDASQIEDLLFANKLVKHSKSNAITLVKGKHLISSGVGQTSRVDALKQAIEKAKTFGFNLNGAVMASDAFFPFPDCVKIAAEAGIKAVIQPGGSVNDKLSIEMCNNKGISMVLTGNRHFKH